MLVQIGKVGLHGQWVNPQYVTSIVPTREGSEVWVVGNAGYGTYSICTTIEPNEVAKLLNEHEQDKKG